MKIQLAALLLASTLVGPKILVPAVWAQPQDSAPAFQLPLFQNSDFARDGQNWWIGGDERVKASYLAVQNPQFSRALHLELTPQPDDTRWSVMFTQPFTSALRAGDVVTVRFWARSPQSLKIVANYEERKAWTKFLNQEIALTPDWKEYTVQATTEQPYGRQDAQFNLHLGQQSGVIELANVRASRPIFSNTTVSAAAAAPAGGTPVLGADAQAALAGVGDAQYGHAETVDVAGQPFTKALRVETTKRPPNEWDFQLGAWSKEPVKKGDNLLASFWARSLKGQAETGEARLTLQFQTGAPEWDKSVSQGFGIPSTWKHFDVPFASRRDMPAGGALLGIPVGFNPQTFEIAGFELQNFGDRVPLESLPRTSSDYVGQEPNAPWRQAALARIEKIRKGDVSLLVQDAKGQPISGAKVRLQEQKSAFAFGTAVTADFLLSTGEDADRYREIIKANYNRAVIENHLKWPYWETWGKADALKSIAWFHDNGIQVRGHNLIWPGWSNLPSDLPTLKDDKAALQKRINDHFADVLSATKGQCVEWDVVNEPFAQHDLLDILGRDAMVGWFQQAKQDEPNARLFINDYPPLDGAALSNEHLNTYYNDIQMLQTKGAPLEGIGFQCHFGSNIIPPERVLSGLDRFSKFKLPIAITEFDMDTQEEDLQARYMRDFLTAAFSHPAVDSVMMWGFWEGRHWLPNAALYRQDWSIKPAGQVWLDLVKKSWWTNASGASNQQGQFTTRGFYGDYSAVVTTPQGQTQTVNFRLTKGNSSPVVVRFSK